MGDGTEPISPDEILYRRILTDHFDPDKDSVPVLRAYHPMQHDTTGISLVRAKYSTVEKAAQGRNPKGYYVAVLKAKDLLELGVNLIPRPLPEDPGHCEIADLRHELRRENRTIELESALAELSTDIRGPFVPASD